MVFIKDAKKEFLDQIINKRVLVFVHLDIDALCSWKILQHLLHCEHILYSVIPIRNKQALEDAYSQHKQVADNIILINCGATLDLVEILQPPEETVFFLIDSLRPLEVRNVYNGVQIKIIVLQSELGVEQKLVPEFEEIFDEEEEEEENDEENDEENSDDEEPGRGRSKRKRFDPEFLEKMHAKREWESKRSKILFEYYKYTYHRCASSMVLFDLAWKSAKDNNDLLWWSIIGLTEQLINCKIDRDIYTRYIVDLNSHVLRHNHRPAANALGTSSSNSVQDDVSINCLKISYLDDLNMVLLRHWSILESIYHSIDLACLFKMWTNKGKKKLNEFLADLGLPLNECKQKFAYMDSSYKNDFRMLVASENIKEKYRYDETFIYLSTFIASFGYTNKLSAFDMAYAVEALLENVDEEKNLSDKFIEALNCLNRDNLKTLECGIDTAKNHLKKIFQQIQNFIDMNQIVASGPFLQVFLDEGSTENKYFAQFFTSKKLARYALQSYLALTKGKKVRNMPLIICIPLNENDTLIAGVPPYRSSNNTENCFGLAFDEAAEKTKSRVNFSYFDTSIIEINNEDRSKFLDALVAVMH
ncbi:cell division control 45 -like protein [Brachionus plicatilis]|uniref:Cell division control 45-like protein n=1 Tax=Brachionus plicatilis TaxID=10195 RepID=A0A3M7R8D3_BRAPC|nr:cell division control 45 -like protein [Brachionus plicatilis]